MKKSLIIILIILVLSGCATTVPIRILRPPTMDTSHINKVAVMPFSGSDQIVATHATNVARSHFQNAGNFTVINSSFVEPLWQAGQNFSHIVDAIFVGEIVYIYETTRTNSGSAQRKDPKTKQLYNEHWTDFIREVTIEFNYSLIMANNGEELGTIKKTGKDSSVSRDGWRNVASVETLANRIIDKQMSRLNRDIVPFYQTVRRELKNANTKAIKTQMKVAKNFVKAGNYRLALETYLDLYTNYRDMGAAENASIMYEAVGENEAAMNFMQRVYRDTGNPRAKRIYDALVRDIQGTARAEEIGNARSNTQSSTEKVATTTADELHKYLNNDSRIWIMKSSLTENIAINEIADNVTSAFLANGIVVVDRQNTELIEAEQRFQTTGHVSDEDIVKIGQLAGANKIVTLSIVNSGSSRRLQVRLIDIEKGVVIMQSDTSQKWNF